MFNLQSGWSTDTHTHTLTHSVLLLLDGWAADSGLFEQAEVAAALCAGVSVCVCVRALVCFCVCVHLCVCVCVLTLAFYNICLV